MINDNLWVDQTLNKGDENFLEQAKLTAQIIKEDVFLPGGELLPKKALIRSNDNKFYRMVDEIFEVLQPHEFLKLTEQVGGPVHSAGSTDDDEIIWFNTLPGLNHRNFMIDNDVYQIYIQFALSYNSDIGVSIIPVAVNITRSMTFNISEMLGKIKPSIRQNKNIKARAANPQEFTEVYNECLSQINEFKGTLRFFSNNKQYSFTEVMDSILPTQDVSAQRRSHNEKLIAAIEENHNAPFGTSLYTILLAIYATDIARHDKKRITLARRFFSGRTSPSSVKLIEKFSEEVAA